MRRPKNWNQPCPNKNCDYYGQFDKGNISSRSTYMSKSGKRRVFHCSSCGTNFSETRDTVFFDLRTEEKIIMMALRMILVKVGLSDITFVLGVKEETLLSWLDRAAKKAIEINTALLKNLPVTEVQLDEMWSYVKRKVSKSAVSENESPQDVEDGRQWVWVSYAPEFRLILAMVVGPRTFESALTLIQMTVGMVLGVPCFFSDGFSCYYRALIECYHEIKIFPRTGKRGRPKDPVKEPHPELVYGQIVKEKENGKFMKITYRIRCGAERLNKLGLKIGTSLLERLNLTIRHALSPLTRKTLGFSKKRANLRKQTTLFQAFYNFARPHMSLREKVNDTHDLFVQRWEERTPGMAAGITDHVWTFRELLTAKFCSDP